MGVYTGSTAYSTPFGLRELRVIVTTTNKALTPSQTLSAKEVVTAEQLEGDDSIVAEHAFPTNVEWEIEAGGIPIAAYALMTGRTISSAGATPTRTNTLTMASGDQYPYFTLLGRSVADDGGDVWVYLYKCKITDPIDGKFEQGKFFTSGIKGIAVADSSNSNKVMEVIQHEQATALPTA